MVFALKFYDDKILVAFTVYIILLFFITKCFVNKNNLFHHTIFYRHIKNHTQKNLCYFQVGFSAVVKITVI